MKQYIRAIYILLLFQLRNASQTCRRKQQPNIIIIVGDDMGYNDVSLRGSNQIPTPNIDALGYNGIVLNKYYVQNACTPTRAAFLTGNYPIRSGMQGLPIVPGQNRSLPLDMPLMPEHLRRLGYKTHIVGKWHLGSAYRSSTPTMRGFDTHFGYWNGFLGYFDYFTDFNNTKIEGFDLHDKFSTPWYDFGYYATHVFTNKALEVIDGHNTSQPLFLMVTHLAAHAGRDGKELGVPNRTVTDVKYYYIRDTNRRLYADVVGILDKSVGKIVKRLSDRHMLKNSIVLFFSDNGAPTVWKYANSGSNWPLRGIKLTNFEGAIKGTATIFSPLFRKRRYLNEQLIHVTDWLPTFYRAAGGDLADLGTIDGIDQWDTLSKNAPTKRHEVLVDIDEVQNLTSMISGRYKLLTGVFSQGRFDGYFGDSGRDPQVPPYSTHAVLSSATNRAIKKLVRFPINEQIIVSIRNQIDLSWCRSEYYRPPVNCTDACLFDLKRDPCETTNIIEQNREVAQRLLERIQSFSVHVVPQGSQTVDPRSNPQLYNNTWCTWLDDSWCVKTPNNTKLT